MKTKIVRDLRTGCTVYGLEEAQQIRELKKEHPEWVDIIDDMAELENILGKKFKGGEQLPYLGAILTDQGRQSIATITELCELCGGEQKVKTPDNVVHPCPHCTEDSEPEP